MSVITLSQPYTQIQTQRQSDTHIDRQTDRQTDIQTDRQTDTQTLGVISFLILNYNVCDYILTALQTDTNRQTITHTDN